MAMIRSMMVHVWPKDDGKTKARVVGSLVLLIGAKLVTVWVPFLFKDLVDSLKDEPKEALAAASVLSTVLLYGFARASAAGMGELRDVVFAKVSQDAIRRIALRTFSHLHSLDLRWHLSRQTGGLARVMDRGSKSIDAFLRMMVFRVVPTGLELSLVTGALASQCGPKFAIASAATLVIYSVFTVMITSWRTKFRVDMNRLEASASTRAVDSLLNYETVKLFGNEKYEAETYDKSLAGYETAALKSQSSLSLLNFGQNVIFTTGLTGMMYMVTQGILDGSMTVGDLVLVNGLLAQLAIPLNFVGTVFRETRQATVDMEEMFKLLNQTSKVQDKPDAVALQPVADPGTPAIEFKDVFFRYESVQSPVLNGLSLSIRPGETVGIVGPSGCGKSTLLRLLFRFFDCEKGSIHLYGKDLKDVTQSSLRACMAVVPQDTVLFNDTLYHNIAYGNLSASDAQVKEAAKRAQLDGVVARMPKGFDTVVGERGMKISGGERQRISIARAMLKNAPLLLCGTSGIEWMNNHRCINGLTIRPKKTDEATSSLDGRTESEVMQSLKLLGSGRTTVIVAHRLATVQDADTIYVLDRGVVVEKGNHYELMQKPGGLYKKMWESQLEAMSR